MVLYSVGRIRGSLHTSALREQLRQQYDFSQNSSLNHGEPVMQVGDVILCHEQPAVQGHD